MKYLIIIFLLASLSANAQKKDSTIFWKVSSAVGNPYLKYPINANQSHAIIYDGISYPYNTIDPNFYGGHWGDLDLNKGISLTDLYIALFEEMDRRIDKLEMQVKALKQELDRVKKHK